VFALIISEKGGAERRQVFEKTEITIGRLQGNDVVLAKGNVSKTHARLQMRDGAFYIADQNSTNGTYVNRKRIGGETAIGEADRVYVGDYVLRVEPVTRTLDSQAPAAAQQAVVQPPAAGAAEIGAPNLSAAAPPASVRPPQGAPRAAGLQPPPGLFPPLPELDGPDVPAEVFERPSSPEGGDVAGPGRVFGSLPPGDAQQGKLQGLKLSQPPPPGFAAERSLSSPPSAAISQPPARLDPAQVASVLPVVRSVVDAAHARFGAHVFEGEASAELRQQVDSFVQVQAQAAATSAADAERLELLVKNELFELGPLGALLADRATTHVMVDGHSGLWVSAVGQSNRLETPFSSAASFTNAMRRLCLRAGSDLETALRQRDCSLPNGFRLQILNAGSGRLIASLVRVDRVQATFDGLVRRGVVSRDMATVLRQCALGRVNVLIVGARPGGASDLLNALAGAATQETWIAIESRDTFLLDQSQVVHVNRSAFDSRLDELVRFVAAVPGARVLVEDLSGDLCASVLQIVAAGVQGVVAVMPASTIDAALERLAIHVAARSVGYDAKSAERALANSFSLVVETLRIEDDRDQVQRICELRCRPAEIELIDLFRFDATAGTGPGVVATGNEPSFAKLLRARGVTLDPQLFRKV
jgi:pilus assembly protein CpaF